MYVCMYVCNVCMYNCTCIFNPPASLTSVFSSMIDITVLTMAFLYSKPPYKINYGWTDRQTGRQTDRQRQTDRRADRQTETDRQTGEQMADKNTNKIPLLLAC